MAPKRKNINDGTDREQNERQRLRRRVESLLIQRSPPDFNSNSMNTALTHVPKHLRHSDGADIIKKNATRKKRYMMLFPGGLTLHAGCKVGMLDGLATKTPTLTIECAQGRLRLKGLLTFPKNGLILVKSSGGGAGSGKRGQNIVKVVECFDAVIAFAEWAWIGKQDGNPGDVPEVIPNSILLDKVIAKAKVKVKGEGEGEKEDDEDEKEQEMKNIRNQIWTQGGGKPLMAKRKQRIKLSGDASSSGSGASKDKIDVDLIISDDEYEEEESDDIETMEQKELDVLNNNNNNNNKSKDSSDGEWGGGSIATGKLGKINDSSIIKRSTPKRNRRSSVNYSKVLDYNDDDLEDEIQEDKIKGEDEVVALEIEDKKPQSVKVYEDDDDDDCIMKEEDEDMGTDGGSFSTLQNTVRRNLTRSGTKRKVSYVDAGDDDDHQDVEGLSKNEEDDEEEDIAQLLDDDDIDDE